MSEQKTISQAVKEEFLDLTRWANNMIRQLQTNFETQHVWPGGFPGPYIGYRNTPAAKKSRHSSGKNKSRISVPDAGYYYDERSSAGNFRIS